MSTTYCSIAALSLNLDMSGMISPCQQSTHWLHTNDINNHTMFQVGVDDLEDAWTSNHRQELLNAHANGIRHSSCKECWDKEDLGVESGRQIANKALADVVPLATQPKILIMKPGNKCNNACRSCNPHTSSMWYKDAYQLENTDKPYKVWLKQWATHGASYKKNTNLESRLKEWQKEIIFWDWYGGEPLIVPLTFDMINHSIDNGYAKDQDIQVHTNGMVYSDSIVSQLAQFKSASLAISIDGVGAKNDYLRYGSKWDDINSVLAAYIKAAKENENITVSVRTSPTILNIYDIDDVFYYFEQLGIHSSINNFVTDEPHNNIQYLPNSIKEIVKNKLAAHNSEIFNVTIAFMMGNPPDHDQHERAFWIHNQKLDEFHGESFADIFPEWHAILANYYES